jgi:PTH2 family peptidyl-tRNA hydrolase
MSFAQVIIVRTDLGMGRGKIASQCGHAVISAFLKSKESKYGNSCQKWLDEGMKKIVLKINSKEELLELFERLKNFFPCALIKDAGETQIPPGTITCLGIGPAEEIELQKYTNHLKLL